MKQFSSTELKLIEEALGQRSVFDSHEQSLDTAILRNRVRLMIDKKPLDFFLYGDDDKTYIKQKVEEQK